MNITKAIIQDLLPLYAEGECSADTRALIDEYLRAHPQAAREFTLIAVPPALSELAAPVRLDEMRAFRETRRRLRHRSWLMALAIFCSLAPFSFFFDGQRAYWLLRDAPVSALVYGVAGAALWITYAIWGRRLKGP